MPRALIKAPPTKNTLLSLKKQVRFLEEGHDLLERKRELLTRLVYWVAAPALLFRSAASTPLDEGANLWGLAVIGVVSVAMAAAVYLAAFT